MVALNPYKVGLKGHPTMVFVESRVVRDKKTGKETTTEVEHFQRPHPKVALLTLELEEAQEFEETERVASLELRLKKVRRRMRKSTAPTAMCVGQLRKAVTIDALSAGDAKERFCKMFGITDAPSPNFTVERVPA